MPSFTKSTIPSGTRPRWFHTTARRVTWSLNKAAARLMDRDGNKTCVLLFVLA